MLTVLGQSAELCDGVTRRELMRVGGLSLFTGGNLPRLLQASDRATTGHPARAKSVILFNLMGGPSQMDMFDLKPNAPVEVRGEFQPIESSLPGLQVCEHLPNTARLMHRACLIRTVTHVPVRRSQSMLVARRLVEAGSRFVTVFWDEYGSVNSAWDTHYWHYPRLTEQLLPGLDRAYSALMLDLEQRGLLEETLVLCISEHGRTPKLDPHGDHPSGTDQGGRNHWSRAYSSVLAGAGICRGKVVGRTDRIAGDVEKAPVSPQDLLATTYHLLGIDPHTIIQDQTGRLYPVGGNGRILREVLA
jgi:hypothetical protein